MKSLFNQQKQVPQEIAKAPPTDAISPYRDPKNPWIYLQLARDNEDIGRITFELYANRAPKTVENFRSICCGDNEKRYTYKKSVFHRIIGNFMAQGGDFENGDGTGGKSIYGSKFRDENIQTRHFKRGCLAMANTGPNSNNSQFYITFCPTDWLDGYHVVFGEMIEGEQTLMLLELSGSKKGDPTSEITITDCGMIFK
eukprot:403343625